MACTSVTHPRGAELFLLRPGPLITIPSGLEEEVEVSTLGIGREEGRVLLGRYIEVLVDLSTCSKFQLQHLLFRRIPVQRRSEEGGCD
jgi:hypothetical protein